MNYRALAEKEQYLTTGVRHSKSRPASIAGCCHLENLMACYQSYCPSIRAVSRQLL